MAVLNAVNNLAPSNAQIGDTIHTDGGDYLIVPPNTPGAKNGSGSGFWSVPVNSLSTPNGSSASYVNDAKSNVNGNNNLFSNAAELANSISARSSAKQYEFNAAEAQKTRDWQEMMSNTAHQREVKDLVAAGLNPVLSATLGGSSTPSGATASGSSYQGQKADVDTSLLPFYGQLLGTVLGNQTQKDIAKIQAETSLQTAKISSAASMYGSNQAAQAARYGAQLSSAASRYGSDLSYQSSNSVNRFYSSLISGDAKSFGKGAVNGVKDFVSGAGSELLSLGKDGLDYLKKFFD